MIINEFDKNIDTIFLSDVHIGNEGDEKYFLLLKLLEEFLGYKNIKRIIFLGDMFDFCTGIHSLFKKKYLDLQKIIERLYEENGIIFYFIEGNHEFYMEELNWKGVVFSRADPVYNLSSNKDESDDNKDGMYSDIILTHGDMLTPSLVYKVYNFMVRSRVVKYLSCIIKMSWLNSFAMWYSNKTRSLHEGNNIKEEVLFDKVNKYMTDKKAGLLVFGHFHRYVCFSKKNSTDLISRWDNLDNLKYGFIGLYDWSNPCFVGLDCKGRKSYLYLKEENSFIKKDEQYM